LEGTVETAGAEAAESSPRSELDGQPLAETVYGTIFFFVKTA
jgi:hypothetical protein